MSKELLAIILGISVAACSWNNNADKTPRTVSGQLNGCMLNEAYDLKDQGRLFGRDKWSVAHDIMRECERKLRISSSEINEKQSLNIIVSVIDSLR